MADTKRLQMLKALTTLLETITPGNGYDSDLTGKVYRGKTEFSDEDMPGVAILQEAPVQFPDEVVESTDVKDLWVLYLQGMTKATALEHPTDDAEALMGEVKKCVAVLKPQNINGQWVNDTLGGTIAGARVDLGTCFTENDQRQDRAIFVLRLSIDFTETQGDPYDV